MGRRRIAAEPHLTPDERKAVIADELKSGIRNIELAVISSVRERGGSITGESFVWKHGADDDRPPALVSARITTNARTACLILPREYCEESASKVSRTEVWDAINICVEILAGERRTIAKPEGIVA